MSNSSALSQLMCFEWMASTFRKSQLFYTEKSKYTRVRFVKFSCQLLSMGGYQLSPLTSDGVDGETGVNFEVVLD